MSLLVFFLLMSVAWTVIFFCAWALWRDHREDRAADARREEPS